jgi:hypothetical protein
MKKHAERLKNWTESTKNGKEKIGCENERSVFGKGKSDCAIGSWRTFKQKTERKKIAKPDFRGVISGLAAAAHGQVPGNPVRLHLENSEPEGGKGKVRHRRRDGKSPVRSVTDTDGIS